MGQIQKKSSIEMEKIKKIRLILKKELIDGYLIPKNDEFFTEYVAENKDRLKYVTDFSGSYGFALLLKNKNYLFVDGRYTLQALKQSGKLFNIITMPNKMPNDILKSKKLKIGFDPRLFTKRTLQKIFDKNNCEFKPISSNIVDKIWKRKIKNSFKKFYSLPENSIETSYKIKINNIFLNLKRENADYQFITASENCAWLLNIRGSDEKYTPIPHSHILVNKQKNLYFFCDLKKISTKLKKHLSKINFIEIKFLPKFLSLINKKKIIIDKNTCSFYFENIISKKNKILDIQDPIYNFKAIKKRKEITNIKFSHIQDGVALTKYLFWLKKNFKKKTITEVSASHKLYSFRKKNKKFKHLSFPTISGAGPNGAIVHYKATNETDRKLEIGDLYLVDSGGQYEFGTTDVTRTISLQNKNKRIKNIFTRVLKGHIAVSSFKIKQNTTGSQIDLQARKYLRQIGLDYSHGTGHGVGYFLNVHEGPQAISKNNRIKLKEGMVLSNEPGYYEKNRFGIRIENLIYIKKIKNKKYFENLTMAPIDKELIDYKILNQKEKRWLNSYHKEVFNNLKNSMNKMEKIQLREACSPI